MNLISGFIGNIGDHFKHNTILGKMISEKQSIGEAVKDTLSEKSLFGRILTKDENIFESGANVLRAQSLPLASIFGSADVPQDDSNNVA